MAALTDDDWDGPRSRTYSARQRVVVLTFDSVADAQAWDSMPEGDAVLWLAQLVALNKAAARGGPWPRSVTVDRPDRKGP